MSTLRIAMMGTGDFAVPTLRALYDTPHEIVALFTRPQPTGKGHHKHLVNHMAELALERSTPLVRPQNVNTPESLTQLRELNVDLLVVAAYGQILSAELLEIPSRAAINVHASLLPRHRGAAPVAYAILSGDAESGVTIFQIQPKLDAGPILAAYSTPIGPDETAGELEKRLSEISGPLTVQVVNDIAAGTTRPVTQDSAAVTLAPKLKKSMGAVDWHKSAREIDWHVRAMQPWPKPFTFWHRSDGKPLRLVIPRVRVIDAQSAEAPGTVLKQEIDTLVVQTATVPLEIVLVQPDGKRAMPAADFLRGYPIRPGDRWGPE